VVEKIGDPLMHLVRNAMDHGIEPAELRAWRAASRRRARSAQRLPRLGQHRHRGGRRRRRPGPRAHPGQGRARPGRARPPRLTDSEIYNLIFEPGFSTAEKVTNLSGRGVGMDVVKRNIEALRGTVDIRQRAGRGHLHAHPPAADAGHHRRLPQVGVGDAPRFVLPLDMVVECIELPADADADAAIT
jgi:two-component system chemotaxis sensor kinase CheA